MGGKYLEMLNVSDTITEMSQEFSNISSSVNEIISVFVISLLLLQGL